MDESLLPESTVWGDGQELTRQRSRNGLSQGPECAVSLANLCPLGHRPLGGCGD